MRIYFLYTVSGDYMILIKRKRQKYIFTLIVILFLITVLFDCIYYKDRVYPGIYLKDIDLGGKSLSQAQHILENIDIKFVGPNYSSSLSLKEMGINVFNNQILEEAYRQGRQNRWPLTYYERLKIIKDRCYLAFPYKANDELLSESCTFLENIFSIEPQNAYFEVDTKAGKSYLLPEKPGYRVNEQKLTENLQYILAEPYAPFQILIPVERIAAEITELSLKEKGITSLMCSFSTVFDITKTNRVHNIELAASILNNYYISPGEIFSLNNVIGDTTPQKGYLEAPIIIGGELVQGFGGGLCQISTTLYNAALLANLEIIERHNHQLTVPYIQPGMDATISYTTKDLKFYNNKDHHILINVSVDNDTLIFSFFGMPLEEKVEIQTVILETYPPPVEYEYVLDLPSGEEDVIKGYPGYLVKVLKVVHFTDKVKSKKIISIDSYLPYPTIIKLLKEN